MGLSLFTKIRLPSEPLSNRTHTIFFLQCLLLHWWVKQSLGLPIITAITAVVLSSVGLEAVGVLLSPCTPSLLLGDVSMTSSASLNIKGLPNVAGLQGVTGLLSIMALQRITGLLRVAGLLSIAELWRIAWLLSVAGRAMSWLLAIFWLLTILLLLADSEGVASIGLGEVNLDHLTTFSKFNPDSLVLPDPISYSLSEL